MKKLTIGMLAHVDAGKTTLSEGLLYLGGSIRKLGRVDNRDSFLDNDEMERARGITIFSKQAVLKLDDCELTLLDTPGHVDFSAEMERTLQVLDYAVLVVSGADGIQGHTLTLWKLLARYSIPVFVFVNKMDQPGTDKQRCLEELQKRLDERCVDFSGDSFTLEAGDPLESGHTRKNADRSEKQETAKYTESFLENLAMCDEALLEQYLEEGGIRQEDIQKLIVDRKVFPCYFGSALKLTGVRELLRGVEVYGRAPDYPQEPKAFSARVFKISRDEQGNRLTWMKLTGGRLNVKDVLSGEKNGEHWEEKVNQIRVYSGAKYETVGEAVPGMVCAVTGLTRTCAGDGLGNAADLWLPVLEPVLSYRIELPDGCDVHSMLKKLRLLEEEEPLLHIVWREQLNEIHAQLMGEVQIDVLTHIIRERFGTEVRFGTGNIVYKETVASLVEGVGHFEPLRHYAEVHLLISPGERGSGIEVGTDCSEDLLDRNWQRLIMTHLEEKEHLGVLIGAPLTDVRITLVSGRAHVKHTEGGDFRQATYRAVRQGLKKAESILLEPYYNFRLELPAELIGRAMTDVQKMSGSFEPPQMEGEFAVLTGRAPVVNMQGYASQVAAYSKGLGRLFCTMRGYEPCHNAGEIIEATAYDAESDLDNPCGSVFCSHGAGFVVPWYAVEEYMHLESCLVMKEETGASGQGKAKEAAEREGWQENAEEKAPKKAGTSGEQDGKASGRYSGSLENDKELEEIFKRTYGESKRDKALSERKRISRGTSGNPVIKERVWQKTEPLPEYLLVDGYNIIFSWEELKDLAKVSMDGARMQLIDILCNYQGFKQCQVILVFDAYKVEGHVCEVLKYHNIYVVYTKEAETADQYIEKTVHELGKKYHVTVATSDGLEQIIILGQGGLRMSAQDLKEEIEQTNQVIRREYLEYIPKKTNLLFQNLDEETSAYIERVRGEEN